MSTNNKLGIILILLSIVSLMFAIIMTLYRFTIHFLILSCSFFIAFFISGLLTFVIEERKIATKAYPSKIKSTGPIGVSRIEEEMDVTEKPDERIEIIKKEMLETIKKLKELELED